MIVNGFLFYNENMLFDIRYAELADEVDWFLVVEASETFTGRKKAPQFLYAHWDKVKHVVIDLPPGDAWARERFQRNSIKTYAQELGASHLIFSDADEIPSKTAVRQWKLDGMPEAAFYGETYYYYFNLLRENTRFTCGIAVDLRTCTRTLEEMRRSPPPISYNGGWHFSFLGDIAYMKAKILDYSHTELQSFAKDDILKEAVKNRRDLFNRDASFRVVSIDELPRSVARYPSFLTDV